MRKMHNAGIGTPYWFEWEIGLLECLKMLQDTTIESVTLQSSDFQCLDDVVVNYTDHSIISIQVKHTDTDNNLTYSFLEDDKNHLLNRLAAEWKKNKDKHVFKEIQIVTNKKWGPNRIDGKCSMDTFVSEVYPRIQNEYTYNSKNAYENNAIIWFRSLLEITLCKEEAEQFTKIFRFRKESCLADVEEKIRAEIGEVLGVNNEKAIDYCLSNLLSQLKIWATSRREKQEITKEDVYAALCYSDPDIPTYEIIPEKPILPSRLRYAEQFMNIIKTGDKHVVFLEGLPGSGKTNFVSYLSQLNDSIVDFRFYTYLPVNKTDGSYSDDEGHYLGRILWLSILVQLKKKFEERNLLSVVRFPLIYRYMSVSEMRDTVMRFLPEYAKCIGRTCYFFVDGIDHAARSNDARNSFLSQLPRPEEIGDDCCFVLVGQPVNDKYPSWLVDNDSIAYINMPSLEADDVVVLLKESKVVEKSVDVENLAKTVISIIGNNVLNIIFAILELSKLCLPLSFEIIEKELTQRYLNKQIDKYYDWIVGSQVKDLSFLKIESVLAFASNRIPLEDFVQMCEIKQEVAQYILNELYPMVMCDDKGYYVFHNDVRLFLQNDIIHNTNFKGIVTAITGRIQGNKQLWRYRYDISFNLLLHSQSINKVMNLMDVGYIMDSVFYGISFDKILQQFILAERMTINNLADACINSSATALCLSQYAHCIQYYEKESEYFEKENKNIKTRSEKYCLSTEKDIGQIIDDIYFAAKVNLSRGSELFAEYMSDYNVEKLFEDSNDKKTIEKAGYIFRCYRPDDINKEIDQFSQYVYFVDGWLEASSNFLSVDDLTTTLKIKGYHVNALSSFVSRIIDEGKMGKDSYLFLISMFLKHSISIAIVIDLCTYGILNNYNSDDEIKYIIDHLEDVKTDEIYEYDTNRILGFIKAWFCTYGKIEESIIEGNYHDILTICRIDNASRGYAPATTQYEIAKHVFTQYNSTGDEGIVTEDDIFFMMCFADTFGAGSCHDCRGNEVMNFIRKVIVNYVERNKDIAIADRICTAVVDYLKWEKTRYYSVFNSLFCLDNAHDQFLKVAEYWCGDKGVAWQSEFDEMEHCCETIIKTLEIFGENEFVVKIREKQKYKMFGYVGRKDYSIYGLIACYEKIPLSESKLCDYGMKMFLVSETASDVGDNRASNEVDRILFDEATKLGYKFLNALFEIKNTPKDLVYWRNEVIDSLYKNIDLITEDTELYALYRLTNAWINSKIEKNKAYGRLSLLKEYNLEVINRISSPELKEQLKSECVFGKEEYDGKITAHSDRGSTEILDLIKSEGYSEKIKNLILSEIDKRNYHVRENILEAGDMITPEFMEAYVNQCVVKYILSESKYGYMASHIEEILERYYEYINDDSWNTLYEDIVNRFTEYDYDQICGLWGDFSTFSIYYIMKTDKGRINELFDKLCDAHMKLLSANGRVQLKTIKMNIDNSIQSLSDMVNFQLNI